MSPRVRPAPSFRGAALALAALARVAAAADVTASPLPAPASVEVHAGAREEYRFRYTPAPEQSDQDVRLGIDLAVAEPTGHFLGAANLGLFWTVRRTGPADGLGTVFDAQNPFFAVYSLAAEYRGASLLRVARVGRQTAEHGRPATFDGAYVLLRPTPSLSLFTFGGRSEHFFEVPHPGTTLWDDWLASVGAGYRPLSSVRFELDYRLLREQAQDPTRAFVGVTDHSYGVSAWLRPTDAAWMKLTVRGLDRALSEASASGHLFLSGPALGLDAKVLVQPATLTELDELENPFFLTLGPSLPHARWRLDASRVFTRPTGAFEAHLGWTGRQLLHDVETAFNRNTGRVYLLGAARDVGVRGLSAQVSLERLTDTVIPFVGRGLFTVNASAAYLTGPLSAEAGVQYYRYQYVYYRDVEELADVRVVFGAVRLKLRWLSVRAAYQLELFDRARNTFTVSLAESL